MMLSLSKQQRVQLSDLFRQWIDALSNESGEKLLEVTLKATSMKGPIAENFSGMVKYMLQIETIDE